MLGQRYGDQSEVVNAHIQEIISLPTVTGVSKQTLLLFLLGGTLNVLLKKYVEHYPQCVHELSEGTYVDDVNIGGDTVEETLVLKDQYFIIITKTKKEASFCTNGILMLQSWTVITWKTVNPLMLKKH